MNLIDCFVMVLVSGAICICLPRMLMLFQSNFTGQRLRLTSTTKELSQPEFSQSNAYPELSSLSN